MGGARHQKLLPRDIAGAGRAHRVAAPRETTCAARVAELLENPRLCELLHTCDRHFVARCRQHEACSRGAKVTGDAMNNVGAKVVESLERAGARYLSQNEPHLYQAFLLNVGATQALRRYDGTETYWDRVQAILDAFFSSSERAEICTELIAQHALWDLPEFRGFLMRALAERRLQRLLATTPIGSETKPNAWPAAVRRLG